MKYTDAVGSTLKIGDIVAYAAQNGDSPCLKIGKITRLAVRKKSWSPDSEIPTIKVRSVAYRSWDDTWELQSNGKEITLEFLNRMVKIEESALSESQRELLKFASA